MLILINPTHLDKLIKSLNYNMLILRRIRKLHKKKNYQFLYHMLSSNRIKT